MARRVVKGGAARVAVAMLAVLIVPALGGCQIAAFFVAVSGDRVRAEYELEDRPTLVMVEDPDDALGNPALRGVLARSIENHLQDRKLLKDSHVIDQRELRNVIAELGDDYARAPIDRIGRLVGAEQVIHVDVRSVRMVREMGVQEPQAEVEVKVIDAVGSRRLFPAVESFGADGDTRPGRRLTTSMNVTAADEPDGGSRGMILRELAERTGRDVARLFHTWYRDERGERLPG